MVDYNRSSAPQYMWQTVKTKTYMLFRSIKSEHFQLPTIEDITTRMANAESFTMNLDANRGHWQKPLDEENQLLTTFNTSFGRVCYQVTSFGTKTAQDVFQKRRSQKHLSELEGVETDIHDIICMLTRKSHMTLIWTQSWIDARRLTWP